MKERETHTHIQRERGEGNINNTIEKETLYKKREKTITHLNMPVPQPTSNTTAPFRREGLSTIARLYASVLTFITKRL